MLPAFTFLQRDAAKSASEQSFVAAVVASRRFWRDEKSRLMFEVAPGDHCFIERKQGFRSILESGEVLRLDGDLDDSAFDTLWIWITAHKWRLPRLNPHIPQARPAPVAGHRYQAPVLGRKAQS